MNAAVRCAACAVGLILASSPACSLLAPGDAQILDAVTGDGGVPSAGSGALGGTMATSGRGGSSAGGGLTGGTSLGGSSGSGGREAIGGEAGGGSAGTGTGNAEGGEAGAAGEPPVTAGSSGTAGGGSAGTGGEDPGDTLVPRNELVLWLRADRGVMSTDGIVSQWIDQSSAALVAVPPSAAASPALLVTGIGERPALEFDGADDMLDLPDGFEDFSAGLSFFSVFELSAEEPPMYGDCPAILQLSNGLTGRGSLTEHVSFYRSGANFTYSNHLATPISGTLQATGVMRRTPHLISVVHDPGGASIYLDATTANALSEMPLPGVLERTYNHVGKSNAWFDINQTCLTFQGKIAEIILFRRPLDSDERLDVARYLRDKYACCPD